MIRFRAVLIAAVLVLAAKAAGAAEVAGVQVDDRLRSGASDLVLNGAGLRTKFFFKVYVAALYVPKKTHDPREIIDSPQPRLVALHMMRDVDADTLIGALKEGLENNNSAAELAALKPEIDQFEALMRKIGKAREGDTVAIDFAADGTGVGFNGQARGTIPGRPFGQALLKVWLGDKPPQADLKQALLGG
jgi:hypothetical protein